MSNSGLQPNETIVDGEAPGVGNGALTEVDPCWNKIGVYGPGTCPDLEKFVHCRNCPVYSNAALELLNRPLPQDYRREWTAHFARADEPATPVRTSAVLFSIHSEWLALPTHAFQEVAERRLIHSLPHRRPGIVLGLVNIRGELLTCVALDRLLAPGRAASRESLRLTYARLLVVSWEGHRLAFPVDEVHGIHRFQQQEMKDPPATLAKSNPCFTQGMISFQRRSVGFLDAPLLFSTLNRSLA